MYVKALGSFPDRIKNLYFSYLFLLRAVNKVCNVCFLPALSSRAFFPRAV